MRLNCYHVGHIGTRGSLGHMSTRGSLVFFCGLFFDRAACGRFCVHCSAALLIEQAVGVEILSEYGMRYHWKDSSRDRVKHFWVLFSQKLRCSAPNKSWGVHFWEFSGDKFQ